MPGGDLCHVGERGGALSGGQRARLALARALYHRCSVGYGVWAARCGLWGAGCGMWSVERGVWAAGGGVRSVG
eukprot:365617-Chlamydomonas_euryale.AAC.1